MTRVLLVALVALLFGVAVGTASDTQAVMFSSDMLLPPDWVHHLFAAPGQFRSFEMPRVPSLLPDMLGILVLRLALPWRLAMLGYAALSFTALVLLGGAVVARWAGRPLAHAAATFGAVAAAAVLLDLQFNHGLSAVFLVLYPVIHSGTVLCTLAGLLLVRRYAAAPGWRLATAVTVLAAVATVSDRLFIGDFVVPAVAGALAYAGWRCGLKVAGIVAAGCVAGTLLDRLLFHTLLVRQPDLAIKLSVVLSRLPDLVRDPLVYVELACAACATLLPARWSRASPDGRFWWAAAAAGSVALMGALPLLYIDWTSYRYVQPVWWWALLALAAALLRTAHGPSLAVAGCGALAVAVSLLRTDLFDVPRLARWRHPAAVCLTDLASSGAVHAALAGYWLARPIAASSEWALPVAQIFPDGKPQLWGNNRGGYNAPFDAVVVDQLDEAALLARFGRPNRRVDCAGFRFWLYDAPGQLRARLAGTDTRLPPADAPVLFTPADLYTRSGRLPPDGAVPLLGAPGRATFGPFAVLQPGSWRMVLRYSLAGTAGQWDLRVSSRGPALAAGPLETGTGLLLSATFDVPDGRRQTELYTYAAPGDRLVLSGLGFCPASLPEDACVRETLPAP